MGGGGDIRNIVQARTSTLEGEASSVQLENCFNTGKLSFNSCKKTLVTKSVILPCFDKILIKRTTKLH